MLDHHETKEWGREREHCLMTGLRSHVWPGHAVISASTYPQTLMREIIVGQQGRMAKAAAQRQQELQFCSVATGGNTGGFLSSNCCSLLPLTDLSSLPLWSIRPCTISLLLPLLRPIHSSYHATLTTTTLPPIASSCHCGCCCLPATQDQSESFSIGLHGY